jgi:hypothetical protein
LYQVLVESQWKRFGRIISGHRDSVVIVRVIIDWRPMEIHRMAWAPRKSAARP